MIILITGSSRGIGRYLAEHYLSQGHIVFGCSRSTINNYHKNYSHTPLDVADEKAVKKLFSSIRKKHHKLDVLINNAGIASMNHLLLTPVKTLEKIMQTNFTGTFLFCREAAKLMKKANTGRIVNFTTVAKPLNLEGEAIYAASKAAVESLTKISAKEFAPLGITVNAIGPTPIDTDLIKNVPEMKMQQLIAKQAIAKKGSFEDVSNVIDFYIKPQSQFITGQILYLGGI
ncbi:MAG: SDR family oxidoreductase [Methylococcales bacterium]|jgi:3-oxoacyl-[acyl-carrier protein] reductase|nr:SDR family oxidoreductase [Methylococcales bacterium]MBT7408335.1 SDR family oxidoreductase [Methylococcales bacterium]